MFERLKIKKRLATINESGNQDEYLQACRDLVEYGEEGVALICESVMNNHVESNRVQDLLSCIYQKEYFRYFIALLASSNGQVRQSAKTVLSENLKEIEGTLLLDLLKESNFYARKNITDLILEKNDPKIAIPTIALFKQSKDDALKKNLFPIFEKFPCPEIKDFLMKLTERCSYSERNTAITLLKFYKDPKVIDFLDSLLEGKDTVVLRNVVESLGMLKAAKSARKIVAMLEHEDLLLRQKAVEALQKMVNPSIIPELMWLFKSSNVNTRRGVIEVLNAIHDEESVTALIKAFSDDDWWVREIATEALSQNRNEMIPGMLQKLLHVKNLHVRLCALTFFTRVRGTFVLKDLIMLLDDEEKEIRLKALEALALLKDDRAVPHILKKATDKELQFVLPETLSMFGTETANKAIGMMLKMGNNEITMTCLRIINKHRIVSLRPMLQELVEEAQFEVRQQLTNTIRFLSGDSNGNWRG